MKEADVREISAVPIGLDANTNATTVLMDLFVLALLVNNLLTRLVVNPRMNAWTPEVALRDVPTRSTDSLVLVIWNTSWLQTKELAR